MDDRELLVRAARAAGVRVPPENNWGGVSAEWGVYEFNEDGSQFRLRWNPLEDDGDAFRLMVCLNLMVDPDDAGSAEAWAINGQATEKRADDPYAATRRAIVRAAATMAASIPA